MEPSSHEMAWVNVSDDPIVAAFISLVGSALLTVILFPLTRLLTAGTFFPPIVIALMVGAFAYRVRTTPKIALRFHKNMKVFEYRHPKNGSHFSPARLDQIQLFRVMIRDGFTVSSDELPLDELWKTEIHFKLKQSSNADGEVLGDNLEYVIPGNARNYERFLQSLLSWGFLKPSNDAVFELAYQF